MSGRGAATLIVKICGITSAREADACVDLGVDWLGVNFVPSSPRRVDVERARVIADAVRGRAEIVGVVAGLGESELRSLRAEARLDRLQLHGDETPELVRCLSPVAYKALRIGSAADVEQAARYVGLLLVDAKAEGKLGGTGKTIAPELVAELARARAVMLAGGLGPANVGEAVRAVRPFGVDVASGVERAPGEKDLALVAAFVAAARRASIIEADRHT